MKATAINQTKKTGIFLVFFLILSAIAFSQETRVVSGILKDTDGTPLPGVNIVVKGTATGTVTDANGHYSIEAPVGSTLVFSFVGYGTSEVYVAPADGIKNVRKPAAVESVPKDSAPELAQRAFKHVIPESPGKTLSPYFFVQSDNPSADRMPLKSTSAQVSISGVIADVKVKQLYVNESKSVLEAIYIFPGSTRAAVNGMTMKVGERVLKARIKEKQQARTEYETAKKDGKTTTLLEQNRPNVFQMNVANILPGDSIEVELSYTELIESLNGIYEFIYPTVVGPRYSETLNTNENKHENWVQNPYLHQEENPSYAFDLRVNVNTGIPLQKIFSPSHETLITYNEKDKATVALSGKEKFGGNRDFILRYGLRGGKVESGVLLHEHGDENFFLLMMEPPQAPSEEDIPPREYVFIVDVSGSMHGFPLDISKSVMRKLLENLRETDKFNILTFAGGSNLMWEKSRPANAANIFIGTNFMNLQHGGGGTRLLDALDRALKIEHEDGYSRIFVVITDGYVDVEKESFNLVRNNLGKANLFALGIGSSTNRYLIEGLAHAGMGEQFIATNPNEGKSVGEKLIEYISKPVLTGITIDFEGFKAYDYDPSSIPDVFAQRPIIVYGKYSGSAEGIIKINGYSGSVPYTKTFSLKTASKSGNQALRYLWARNRVRYIDDYAHYYISSHQYNSRPAKTPDQVNEITNLGLKYNILTQYTSFIAVDSLVRNKSSEIVTVKQPLPLPKGVSDLAVGNHGRTVSSVSSSSSDISVALVPDISSLQEVVVVGYGVSRKSELTGSVSSVSFTDGSDPSSLQGKLSGVQITNNSGAPGTGTTIRIRGVTSLMGNTQPLYVIDGIPVAANEDPVLNPLLNINPSAIGSVEILKDASAAAIYGSRGANGVILINTLQGTYGKTKVSLSASSGVTQISSINRSNAHSQLWYNNIIRNGVVNNLNFAVSKRTQKIQYMTSLGFSKEKGILENTGLKKYTGNFDIKRNFMNGRIETGISAISGYSVQNDFLLMNVNPSGSMPVHAGRKYFSLNGKVFMNVKLPVEGLLFRNEIFESVNSKNIGLDQSQTPVSFLTIMNDNVQLQNTGFNTGLGYSRYLKNNQSFDANILYELNNTRNKYNNLNKAYSEIYPGRPLTQRYLISSFIARVNYNFNDRYLVSTTIRRDLSQRFATREKAVTLPSLSVAWNAGNENFMRNSFISNLKFRYSIGSTASCQLPFYPLTSVISGTSEIDIPSLSENRLLKWEKTNKQNAGIDVGLFNNRINFGIDVFVNKTYGMYYLSRMEEQSSNYQWINAGNYSNKGFDFSADFVLYNGGGFNIKAFTNISGNATRITALTGTDKNIELETVNGMLGSQLLKTGDPIGVYYGLKVMQIDNVNRAIEYQDVNNDGSIDRKDLQKIAAVNPKFYGGTGLQVKFRSFEVYSYCNYVSGNQVINTVNNLEYRSYSTDKPIIENLITSLDVENGSYLRLSELTVGYTIPARISEKVNISNVRIRFTANNLLTFTKYSGQDPEFNHYHYKDREMAKILRGVDRGFYPVSKCFLFKLDIGF